MDNYKNEVQILSSDINESNNADDSKEKIVIFV